MTIHVEQVGDVVVVAPVGRVDSRTSSELDARLLTLDAEGRRQVVVDFSGVEYISSAGLRVMLTLAKRAKDRSGRLALCSLDHSVKQVFDLAGFTALFAIVATRDDAIAAAR
jgi:stage II sporulation protein AA (anti-sigma F factor antagonist)